MKTKRLIYKRFAYFYDKAYSSKFYHQYFVFIEKSIRKHLRNRKPRDVQILDLACGTGRLIKKLSCKYGKVEGVDFSKEMLFVAQKRNKGVRFYNQDFANLSIPKKYDVIISTFDSINYILSEKDLSKTFQNVTLHLKSNGLFIFDFNTPYKKVEKIIKKKNIVYINSIIQKHYWSITINIKEGNKVYTEKHKERLYSFREIKNALTKQRLRILEVYSDFDNKVKVDKVDKFSRLIIVASK